MSQKAGTNSLCMLMQCAIYGNFSAPKAQEIVVSRGRILELIRPGDNGRLQIILSTDVFGCIRSLATFRLTGAQRDYIIVGSDSGRIVILDYNKDKNQFVKVGMQPISSNGQQREASRKAQEGSGVEQQVPWCEQLL